MKAAGCTTIVVIDGMVRNVSSQLVRFAEMGTLIKCMLTVPLRTDWGDAAAKKLFAILEQTYILCMSTMASGAEESCGVTRGPNLQNFRRSLLGAPDDIFTCT